MPFLGLTDKQRTAYVFIEAYIASRHRPPTLQEITDALGAKSINTAQKLVHTLEQKGYITREKGRARSLALSHTQSGMEASSENQNTSQPTAPVHGTHEILIRRAGDNSDSPLSRLLSERLHVDRRFFRGISSTGSCYAIRAGDHAMQPDGIFRGDLVIAESISQDRVETGELVVCLRRGEFLIRRFEELGSLPALVASDPSYSTIHPDSIQTQITGRVIAIMRRL